ncbi:MAG: M48 family metallopeptidase [Pseudomonadales bacterium]|nr:M48 family metallopeptidase [Pseudomonadales bacterium]
MDFFQAQDTAKRKTGQLVLLFTAAVLGLIVLTNILLSLTIGITAMSGNPGQASTAVPDLANMSVEQWIYNSLAVLTVISLATIYKYLQVRGGGRAVAESLGGIPLDPNSKDPKQRRLQNIVQEMAIASGLPVPPIYLLKDPAINAFAAGLTPGDAVIGVTQGTLDLLNRDELQAVIGHEFSHILNGDTRINLRLIAILHGILFIGLIGAGLLRGRLFSSRSKEGGLPIAALAIGLLVIGYAGTFFGSLIKAAVSRQREFLADSASVQFTRNPSGLSQALQKIGGAVYGSNISKFDVEEASHMFFGQAVNHFMNTLMATHPPLEKRILAIDPQWQGKFPETITVLSETEHIASQKYAVASMATSMTPSDNSYLDISDLPDSVGNPKIENLNTAQNLIESSNSLLMQAAHDAWAVRTLIYALLLDKDIETRKFQLDLLGNRTDAGEPEYLNRLLASVDDLDHEHKLLLLSASMPALKSLSHKQYKHFMGIVVDLIKIDNEISLFEWVLYRILVKDLKGHYQRVKRIKTRHRKLESIAQDVVELLAALARVSDNPQVSLIEGLNTAGMAVSGLTSENSSSRQNVILEGQDPNFRRLNSALQELRALHPLEKPRLIKACAATVLADGLLNQDEMALLQGMAATLDCPLPPILLPERN